MHMLEFQEYTWRKVCSKAFFLSVLGIFFFLPFHSDPTVLVIVAGFLSLLAVGKPQIPSGLPCYALLAFAGYALVALMSSVKSGGALSKYSIVLLWSYAILAGMLFRRAYPNHKYIFLLATTSAVVLSLGIGILHGFDSPQFWHDSRLKLFAVHPSRLALYCAVSFLFCLHTAITIPRVRARLAFILLAAITAFCLYLTSTRGVILVLPLGVICLVAGLPLTTRKYFLVVFIVCIALAGTALWITKNMPFSSRVFSAVTDIRNDPTFRSRLPIWEVAWSSFKDAPLIGHGIKSYPRLHAKYLAEHREEWDERYLGSYESAAKNAHNIILGRLVESGTLGTVCFIIFYGIVLATAFNLSGRERWVAALFVFYMGVGMIDDTLFRRNDTFIFFIAGAVLGQGNYSTHGHWRLRSDR